MKSIFGLMCLIFAIVDFGWAGAILYPLVNGETVSMVGFIATFVHIAVGLWFILLSVKVFTEEG
jgi:hypothetical protein